MAQTLTQAAPAPAPAIGTQAVVRPNGARAASSNGRTKQATKPLWSELSPAQQEALGPLSAMWNSVSEAQKRKWLALSENYPKMSGDEQAKLHSRMSDWAALSPQQRTRARLNFGKAQQLSPDDKKAKWEAYQALSPEEKSKLAARAAKSPGTAAAIKPVTPDKLATVPQPQSRKIPRISAAPNQVDRHTLLPQQQPQPAPLPRPTPAAAPTN